MKNIYTLIILSSLAFFSSCDKNRVYEKNYDIYSYEWTYENVLKFDAEIIDSTPKNVIINFRHTYFFQNRNVVLSLEMTAPNGNKETFPINIPLSEPNGMWYSECSGDICDIIFEVKKLSNYSFIETGVYHFELTQNMRTNPLLNVMGAGLRIENLSK